MYQLNSCKDNQNVPSNKKSKLECPPLPVSWHVDSDVIRYLARCAVTEGKSFLQNQRSYIRIDSMFLYSNSDMCSMSTKLHQNIVRTRQLTVDIKF